MQKFVIPKKGLIVRDPIQFNPLSEKGEWVDWSGHAGRFWRRRVKCGDVSIAEKPVAAVTTSKIKRKKED